MMSSLREWRSVIAVMALVLTALIWAAIYSTGGRWQPFVSVEGGFRAEFPGKPRVERRQNMTIRGAASISTYSLRQPKHSATYLASFADYPPATEEEVERDLLTDTCDGFVGQVGGTISEPSSITMNGYSGREMWLESSQVGRVRLRVLVIDRRVYMLAVYPVNREEQQNVERFFTSFALTGQPARGGNP